MSSTFSRTLQNLTPKHPRSCFPARRCGLAFVHITASLPNSASVSEAGASRPGLLETGQMSRLGPAPAPGPGQLSVGPLAGALQGRGPLAHGQRPPAGSLLCSPPHRPGGGSGGREAALRPVSAGRGRGLAGTEEPSVPDLFRARPSAGGGPGVGVGGGLRGAESQAPRPAGRLRGTEGECHVPLTQSGSTPGCPAGWPAAGDRAGAGMPAGWLPAAPGAPPRRGLRSGPRAWGSRPRTGRAASAAPLARLLDRG